MDPIQLGAAKAPQMPKSSSKLTAGMDINDYGKLGNSLFGFKKLDTNGDGKLSQKEIDAYLQSQSQPNVQAQPQNQLEGKSDAYKNERAQAQSQSIFNLNNEA